MKQISVHGSVTLVGTDSAEAVDLVQPKGCYAETSAALLSLGLLPPLRQVNVPVLRKSPGSLKERSPRFPPKQNSMPSFILFWGHTVLLHSEVTLGGGLAGSHHHGGGSKHPSDKRPFVEMDMLRASSEDTGLRTQDLLVSVLARALRGNNTRWILRHTARDFLQGSSS